MRRTVRDWLAEAERAASLGDRTGARVALAEAAHALRVPWTGANELQGQALGDGWVTLARSFAQLLGEAGGRRCLEQGAEVARQAGDAGALAAIDEVRAGLEHAPDGAVPGAGCPGATAPRAERRPARALPGWESSPTALLEWLRARVPPEGLPRGGVALDPLGDALDCALCCVAPEDEDELVTDGVLLVERCLALGAEASDRCAQLLAWRYETDDPEVEWGDEVDPDRPIALLLLLLVGAARAPGDPRLPALVRALVGDAGGDLEALARGLAGSPAAALWCELLDRWLAPLTARHAELAALLAALALRAARGAAAPSA